MILLQQECNDIADIVGAVVHHLQAFQPYSDTRTLG
jgi:hypothetical protein